MVRCGQTLTAFCRKGWLGWSCRGGTATAETELVCCWTPSLYIRVLTRVCRYMSQNVLRLYVSLLPHSLWQSWPETVGGEEKVT